MAALRRRELDRTNALGPSRSKTASTTLGGRPVCPRGGFTRALGLQIRRMRDGGVMPRHAAAVTTARMTGTHASPHPSRGYHLQDQCGKKATQTGAAQGAASMGEQSIPGRPRRNRAQ